MHQISWGGCEDEQSLNESRRWEVSFKPPIDRISAKEEWARWDCSSHFNHDSNTWRNGETFLLFFASAAAKNRNSGVGGAGRQPVNNPSTSMWVGEPAGTGWKIWLKPRKASILGLLSQLILALRKNRRWCWEFRWRRLWWWKSASAQQTFSENKYLQRGEGVFSLVCWFVYRQLCVYYLWRPFRKAHRLLLHQFSQERLISIRKLYSKGEISQLCRRILSLVIAQSREGAKRGFLSLRAQLLYFHTTVKMEQKLLMVLAAAHSAAKSFPLGVSNVFKCSLTVASFILAVLY